MPLTIIKGPPNSGRTELVRERFEARLADDPVLVVPSTDDIFGWERRLTRERGAFIGGKVLHFKDLVNDVLLEEGATRKLGEAASLASPIRRRKLTAAALAAGWPLIADRITDQPGLVDAALRVIDELRENLISPEALDELIDASDGNVPVELAAIYRLYLEGLADSGHEDLPQLGVKSVQVRLDVWAGRPVFVAGFDDLTKQQITLLTRLGAVTDVTIAITHEVGNPAMSVTEGLLGLLLEAGGSVSDETVRPSEPVDHDPLLFALESGFQNHDADHSLTPSGALTLLESSGRRGEAESIGAEIAQLISNGTDPGQIAIAIDAPALNGAIFRDVLSEYRIPATLEAETTAAETAVGQAVLNLLRAASSSGKPEHLFALARGPVGIDRATVDQLELEVRREGIERVDEIAGLFREKGTLPPGWDQVRSGEVTRSAQSVAELAARNLIAEGPGLLSPGIATETQMSTAIVQACKELADANGEVNPDEAREVVEALESGVVKTWAIPTANTVRIASPYSLRAKRVEYLFMASLQERSLGDDGGGPFLTKEARARLGLPEKTDAEAQELYLFHTCISVPTRGLFLSTRTADVHGKTEFPSPMIAETMRLFDQSEVKLKRRIRSSSEIVFPVGMAPNEDELIRSVAAGASMPPNLDHELEEAMLRLRKADETEQSTRSFGPLGSLFVKATQEDPTFSASQLEAFIECPYKWFFERAMNPVRFGPEPEAMARGTLIHEVLAQLYEAHLGKLPTRNDVHDWILEASELTEEIADGEEIRLGSNAAGHQIERRRVMAEISRFLVRESRRVNPSYVPLHLEKAFGMDKGDGPEEIGPVDFGAWRLRGKVDRIDVSEDGRRAIVLDYKSGKSSFKTLKNMRKDGKVQLHLYSNAVARLWDVDVLGALYVPLFRGDGRPRGLLSKAAMETLSDMKPFSQDVPDDFEAELSEGVAEANLAALEIRNGAIRHTRGECRNHFHHAGVPDWKLSDTESGEKE